MKSKTPIHSALLKYGYSNFSLEILEYCEREKAVPREQYYFDLFKPRYNILKIAGSSLGYKHTEQTRDLIRQTMSALVGHIHTKETRTKISEAHLGKNHSEETRGKIGAALKGRKHTEQAVSKLRTAMLNKKPSMETREKMKASHNKAVVVINVDSGEVREYLSIKHAAKGLNTSSTTIRRYLKNNNKLYDIYLINLPSSF